MSDYADLLALYARYCFGVDSHSAALLGTCFAEDVSFGVVAEAPTVGRDAVVARLTGRAVAGVVHHAFNLVVLTDDGATRSVRADFTMVDARGTKATGTYDDRVVTSATGELVFTRRLITYTWQRGS